MEFIIYLLKSTAVVCLFILVYELFLKGETIFKSNRLFLLSGMLVSVVLPILYFKKTIHLTQIISPAPVSDSSVSTENVVWSENLIETPSVSFWENLEGYQIVLAVYLLIVAVLLIRLSLNIFTLQKFLKSAQLVYRKNGIRYYETSEKTGPFSFFNRVVYNPNLHKTNDLELILKHEEAHAKAYHSIDILWANFMACWFWFNPLMYVYRKRISQNLEFLADQAATQNLASPKAYQLSLLSCAKAKFVTLPVNNFHKSFIQTRIKKLHQNHSKKSAIFKTTLILPFLIGFFFLFQIQTKAETHYITQEISFESTDGSEPIDTVAQTTKLTTTLDKKTENEYLDTLKKFLKKEFDVDFTFHNIHRNSQNELTQISLQLKNKQGDLKDLQVSNKGNAIADILMEINREDENPLVLKMVDSHKVRPDQNLSSQIRQYAQLHNTFIFNGKETELKHLKDMYFNSNQIRFEEDLSQMYITGQALEVENMKEAFAQHEGETLVKFAEKKGKLNLLFFHINKFKTYPTNFHIDKSKTYPAKTIKPKEKNQSISVHKIEVKIVKTTTEKSLKEMQQLFKSHQIDFSYAALSYDDAGNLTQIALELTTQDGKTRKYSVIGDQPIPEIHVIVSDDFTGFQTFNENQKPISTGEGSVVILTGKPTKGLDDKLKAALTQSGIEVLDSTRKATDMIKSIDVRKSDQYPLIIIKGKDVNGEDISQPHTVTISKKIDVFTVDKQTTDEDLEKIKDFFAQNEIDLNYRVAHRNRDGEITKIKVNITDKKGKKSAVTYQNNKGITSFKLGLTDDGFFIE